MDSNWDGLMRFRRVMKQFAGPFPVVPDIYWCVNTGNGHVTSARPRGLAVTGRYASGIFTPPTPHYPDTSGSHADHMRRAGGISFNQPFPHPPPLCLQQPRYVQWRRHFNYWNWSNSNRMWLGGIGFGLICIGRWWRGWFAYKHDGFLFMARGVEGRRRRTKGEGGEFNG